MIDRKSLLADLQKQVKAAENDLEQQVKALPDVAARLRGEYDQARKLGRTAATWNAWLGDRVTQVAVAWVLGTVFVRFSEDNGLIPEPYITAPNVAGREIAQARYEEYLERDADPTYRGWLEAAFAELGAGQAGRLLFDPDHNPLFQIPLSHDGAGALLAFWREQRVHDSGGSDEPVSDAVLVHDFRDPLSEDGTEGWDTRFLGDLYQDLSEAARKTYALLQTPEFVEEFILDRTMTPAVREFGFEELKMIDPTCGSGHFVLGAFRRLVRLWAEQRPEVGPYERVRAALESVHGVDLNPFAVAVARFRLLVAAMAASGITTFAGAQAYEWPIQLAVGDSLIKDRQLELELQLGLGERQQAGDPLAEFSYVTEDLHDYDRILEPGRYHVVVGNPPYITVKDKKLNQLYRELYDACAGTYALSVPFAQRFFELAKRGGADGEGYGMVGQITANSFMKREFGTKLVEEFFAHKVELSEVIDTSGSHIPGHGTPTVVLVGRPRAGSGRSTTIRSVRSVRGEPSVPAQASEGFVWKSIVQHIDIPGWLDSWIAVDDLDRDQFFATHPWALAAGGQELVDQIHKNSKVKLSRLAKSIGASAVTREDSAFMLGRGYLRRHNIPEEQRRPLVEGTALRDYIINEPIESVWPYSEKDLSATAPLAVNRTLWPTRRVLRERTAFGKTQVDRGLTWFEYSMFFKSRYRVNPAIAVAFVATHNHFALSRPRDVFQHSALILEPREEWSQNETHQLLSLLNSSVACFWLKQVCHDKGHGGIGGGVASEEWEKFYEFNSTNLADFPIPRDRPGELGDSPARLIDDLQKNTPATLCVSATPTAAALREAEARYRSTRARMIALQEELDWHVYSLYNLHSEDLRLPDPDSVPELALGERAFEIVLARGVKAGEVSDEWFKRHGSTPITEIPKHWPVEYRALVQKRIDAIESNRAIGMIERPEYKRRWATEGWDAMRHKALRSWLLDRIEDRSYWFDEQGNPTITTLARLAESLSTDEDFTAVAELYAPRQDLAKIVRELLSEEHVPFVSALRYKPAGLKKRADWEHVWELQREEDVAPDEPAKRKIRERTPVPPKYIAADFLKPSYWRARGKLDVPKERFVSYGTANVQSPELYGWAGWDHLEQALALASYVQQAGLGEEEIVPYLAGLLELQPWLDQWYGKYDPEFGASPAAEILAFRQQKQGELGLTDDALRAWRPAAATRGRGGAKKATASKKTAVAQSSADDIPAKFGTPAESD
ncbi:BREX-2 system adenine-specific DNA-methyltransferase PglX [Streptomyces hoynatensis]|uniref:site-specific DNA-methyltransferase (adenine-specific) n=1 Tax=Streptomyces hoynatensis TaxID=1141874 RepID=A0A3A9YD11_9ACTN|nr:BREX-2 system adenine-specific DNA-methyltransferase PglX [Streptomyces hoynatensis]RKN35099.1 BREX-2 system adenine-specific DNA-methyltransferase PglX [Streptomyces hoynatensis]